jgi:pilus assembly protein CpaD
MKLNLRHVAAMALLTAALAGCDSPAPPPAKTAHVRQESVSHAVLFHDGSMRMAPSEQDALASFVNTVPAGAVSSVGLAVDDTNLRAVARARSVRDYLVKQGFSPQEIRMQPTPGIDPLTVMLSIRYAQVMPPGPCPDWSKNSIHNYENSDESNFGCAYYNNLIVQLANPSDYNGGHGTPVFDGPRDSVIMQRYLADTPPPAASGGASASAGGSSGASAGGGGTTTTTTSSP